MSENKRKPLTIAEQEKAKALFASGKTYHSIAVELARSPHTVKRFLIQPDAKVEVEELKEELSDMFEGLAKRMLASVKNEDIEKINAYQRILSAAVSTDKMRLLRNQSTENVSVRSTVEYFQAEGEKIRKLREEIQRRIQNGSDTEEAK